MPSHAPRSPADRRPAAPVVQAKAVRSSVFDTARRTDTEQRPAAPVGPKISADAWHGFSFADVPVHAPTAAAPARSGLPAGLKAGVEQLSGFAMDDVRVHRDSAEPAKLGALAFARGSDIHLGPGQERHLPHEAWHVVQQKQGRVTATAQMKGGAIGQQAGLEAEADAAAEQLGQKARLGEPARTCVEALFSGGADAAQLLIGPIAAMPGAPAKVTPEFASAVLAELERVLKADYGWKMEQFKLRDLFKSGLSSVGNITFGIPGVMGVSGKTEGEEFTAFGKAEATILAAFQKAIDAQKSSKLPQAPKK